MRAVMLTTIDNPFDPFDKFEEWFAFDLEKGYNSCAYLERIANSSDELSEADSLIAAETAIDEIVRENPLNIFRKVSREI